MPMNYTVISIDPGANGAIVEYRPYDSPGLQVRVHKMPETPKDIYSKLASIQNQSDECVCVIEKVGFHVKGNNASASCKFARHCGHLEMALIALGIPIVEEVTPQKWMKSMGTLPKDKTARKRAIKNKMQMRYPWIQVTLWNADALGLLEYYMD